MDAFPPELFGTLFGFLRAQALRQRREAQARQGGAHASPVRPADEVARWQALVEEDRLFVHVPARPAHPGAGRAPAEGSAVAPVESFRAAFVEVWARIPESDRQALLAYWRADRSAAPHRPLIRLVHPERGARRPRACGRLGHELTFRLAPVLARPRRARRVIARALALAHRYATCQHWKLVLDKVEGPMAAWERRYGQRATEADRDARHRQLTKAYLVADEAEVQTLLRGWGFADRAAPAR
jgi:hypothetical protein